ncbi:34360_t:CDS:2, partial [Racocetra persica]
AFNVESWFGQLCNLGEALQGVLVHKMPLVLLSRRVCHLTVEGLSYVLFGSVGRFVLASNHRSFLCDETSVLT